MMRGAAGERSGVSDRHEGSTANERALIEAATALTSRLDVAATCSAMLDAVERIFEARSS
jgi:hypothetical protein